MASEPRVVAECPMCGTDILSDHILTRCAKCDCPLTPEIIKALSTEVTASPRFGPIASQRFARFVSDVRSWLSVVPEAGETNAGADTKPVRKSWTPVRGRSDRIQVTSHWHHSVENLNTSTLGFYKEIEKVLIAKKAPVKAVRVDWRERGIFSAKREYLRVTYQQYVFDICAAPFGNDYFWSWWLGTKPSFLESLPYIGFVFKYFVKPDTYHSEDTRQMFQDTVHRVVLDVVSGVLSVNKMSPLSAAERELTKRKKGIEVSV